MKDKLFKEQKGDKQFAFTKAVADVFDDMACRSIPLYEGVQKEIAGIVAARTKGIDGSILDLGCSTGYTLELVRNLTEAPLIGVDSSIDMIEKATLRLKGLEAVTLHCFDVREFRIPTLSAAILNYILQFLPISDRLPILRSIFDALSPGGVILVSEKTVSSANSDLYNELYWDMKRRNGYSEEEIRNKHRALEGVLVPLTADENISLLKGAGFKNTTQIFRGYQFVTLIGEK